MEALNIVIQSLADAAAGKPLVANLTMYNHTEVRDFTVGIQQAGTQSGKTSLAFILKDQRGHHYVGQMTEAHFETLINIYREAQRQFGR